MPFYYRELEGVIASLRELEDNTFFECFFAYSRRINYWPITPCNSLPFLKGYNIN